MKINKLIIGHVLTIIILTGLMPLSGSVLAQADPKTESANEFAWPDNLIPEQKIDYYQAKVNRLLDKKRDQDPMVPAYNQYIQLVEITLLNGPEKNQIKEVQYYPKSGDLDQLLKAGEKVFVTKVDDGYSVYYGISDRYRLNTLFWIAGIFI